MERCEKELSPTDVNQRLAVTKEMLEFLPPIDPENDVPVRVLDETGKVYVFYLSCRQGKHRKPVFQSKHWRVFVKERDIAAGDVMYFWAEENAFHQTQYRIALLKMLFS
ncbi:hypothetical protein ACE6H2_027242 [Prunus campanulata]